MGFFGEGGLQEVDNFGGLIYPFYVLRHRIPSTPDMNGNMRRLLFAAQI